jgi:hypothetical protein
VKPKSSLALSALAFASVLGVATDAALGQQARKPLRIPSITDPEVWIRWKDSADPAALKECRKDISQPSSTTKVGPLQPLRTAGVRHNPLGSLSFQKPVRMSNLRMYAARVQTTGLFGNPIDRHEVCFFEKVGNTYRFVQSCITEHHSAKFVSCNLGWLLPDPIYNSRYPKDGSK